MKAMLLTAAKQLELQDLPEPALAENEVLIRVAACGVCGSDVHGYDGSTGRRIPPLVMGHEAAGVVEQVGAAVTNVRPGARVTFDSTVYCGECGYCRSGRVNLCDNRQVLGVSCGDYRRHGAFAELVAVPAHILYELPESFPFEHAALIEAVSVAVHAVELAPPQPGQTAVVVGAGMIGLLIVQAARAAGCEQVIAVDVDDDRLAMAKQFGAAQVVNAGAEDAAQAVRGLTGGAGAELAYEAVGMTETVRSAVGCVAKGASVVLVGNLSPNVELPLQSVVTREIRVQGSCASAGEYPKSIELMASGAIDVSPLISAVRPLDEGPDWFARLYNREPGLMKVVLTP